MQRRAIAKPLNWYEDNAGSRNQAIINAYASGDYSMKQVADWFGVHYSTVSRVVKKAENV
ncbi:MAG: helix-turn-helix domain-containing protein [Piscirickettsiaceae bacterium]|nr:helix-turn-helix domain-containing protein [Piscirickettsiaceae bacterium]